MPLTESSNERPSRALAAAFPVALWFLSTYFFFGDTGRWNDDYFCTLRDPETGGIAGLAFTGPLHFWRPLYRVLTPTLHTLLWQDLWALHLIGALVHGLTAWLLWRVLGMLGLARLPAAAGALIFLVYPAHYEGSLWPTAMPTALATALHLVACMMYLRWARGGLGWWLTAALAAITFAIASLNEQPVGGILVFPLIYFAACPPQEPVRRALARALIPAGAAVLSAMVYVACHYHFCGPGPRTGNGSFVDPAEAAGHLKVLARLIGDGMDLNKVGDGAFMFGWAMLRGSPVVLAVWAVALAAAAAEWVRVQARTGDERDVAGAPGVHPGVVAILGVALFLSQWLAIAPIHYWINSRLFYAPMVGAAMAVAGCGDLLVRAVERFPRAGAGARLAAGIVLALGLTASAVMMIGVQGAYRERDRQDQRDAAALRAAIPDPAPGSTLVPVMIQAQAFSTGSRKFDLSFRTPFMSWWSATNFTRFSYRRKDLNASIAEWQKPAIRGVANGEIATYDQQRVPIALAIPFEIDVSGELRVVTSLRVVRPGREPELIHIPQTAEAAAAGRIPEREFAVKLGKGPSSAPR